MIPLLRRFGSHKGIAITFRGLERCLCLCNKRTIFLVICIIILTIYYILITFCSIYMAQ